MQKIQQNCQPGILESVPRHARYLNFSIIPGSDTQASLHELKALVDGQTIVAGIGLPLIKQLNANIAGMRDFTPYSGPGFSVPANSSALWFWLRSDDRGELLHLTREIELKLSPYFQLDDVIEAFQYKDSRDLTGYEDGTENPEGDDAVNAALMQHQGSDMDGSSFVAVQQWLHDLDKFQAMSQTEQDHTIGRQISDNEEIDDAPESAHVKRTAQEDFSPEAFVLRRSMPWSDAFHSGLVFVSFGHSFDAFEALLKRMTGSEDNIVDALFSFTQPINGSYFWCPPMENGELNLSALGI